MIQFDGKAYKLVQLDTNALSNVVKAKDDFLKILMNKYSSEQCFFSYSPFSILEIKKSEFLYKRFCELFSLVPSFLLKGYYQLWNEEITLYDKKETIDCTNFCLHDIKTDGKLLNNSHVNSVFSHPKLVQAFNEWEIDKQSWFDRKLQARQYLGFDLKYDRSKILNYVKEDVIEQFKTTFPSFFDQKRHNLDSVTIEDFRSFKIMAYMTYYKFHADKRIPVMSDIYDILIAATVPYVDVIITEGQMADSLKKIKKIDNFIGHLEIKPIKEI